MRGDLEARLLAGRDVLSVREREAIRSAVLASVNDGTGSRWPSVAGALAGAAVIAMIVWLSRSGPDRPPQTFAARGEAAAGFRAGCAASPCRRGDKLLFELAGVPARGYFAAFARRPDGVVIWYLPGAERATSVSIAEHLVDGTLDTGIEIGDEHLVGAHRIYGVFSARPLTRSELREAVEHGDPAVRVVVRELEVAP